jgi:NAD+ synthase (glutamine-hydrolysing)
MRVALGQVDVTVGDIEGNTARILEAIGRGQAEGAGFTLLPELAITGYPPEDLLAKEHFVEANLNALEQIAAASWSSVLVGFVDRVDGALYNAMALCGNGRLLRVYHKRRLPNYGVFDERRYFEPGDEPGVFELGGTMFAMTVCEDVWVPEPARETADLGCSVLFNISASPYHEGKGDEREQMLRGRARENGLWLVYCNLVGGQDELVFDGRSLVISPRGEVVARGAAFAEDFVVADFAAGGQLGASGDLAPQPGQDEEVYHALRLGLRDYLVKNGFTDAVIGLSGGVDSALTATLAVDALGAAHVHGVMMPSRYSSTGSIDDSLVLAANLGIDVVQMPIEDTFSAFEKTLAPVFDDREPDVTEENLQARVRGTLLMALSNKFRWLVLATGNKSELSVGYSTLYGDMVGGFAPLKDVFKTQVYALAHWRNGQAQAQGGIGAIPGSILSKAPSAELRPHQTDQDSLPPYEVLDPILERYVELDASQEEIVAEGFDAQTVARVCRLVDLAEYKRRQGPLGIRVTTKAFGKDRRMPITNAYRG